MKGASKVIMGATLVMVVSLAIVLGLVLVLLAELYCTLLLRRRQLKINSSNAAAAANTTTIPTPSPANTSSPHPHNQSTSPPTTYYTPGVIQAPRNLFFPSVSCKENKVAETNNQNSQFHHILEIHTQESNTSPQHIGLINTSPPLTSLIRETPIQISSSNANEKTCVGDKESFVYISNPIYDNDGSKANRVETPFETPDSSPSRLETGGSGSSSGGEEIAKPSCTSSPQTPPLTPMKKLPAEACSVSLRDARSLGTSGSDSNGLSSSSSGSPCTSPSW